MSPSVSSLTSLCRGGHPLNRFVFEVILTGLLGWCTTGYSQTLKPAAPTPPTVAAKPLLTPSTSESARPAWSELTPGQRHALAPLASNWSTISEAQKRKWLEISKNYASLSPEGQATLNGRMNEWVLLSPQQRAQARLNFGKTKELSRQLSPEEKNAQWQAYQALSPEEKQKLAAKASPKPAGAATAVKPVAPQKLATVPNVNKPGVKPALKMDLPPPVATP